MREETKMENLKQLTEEIKEHAESITEYREKFVSIMAVGEKPEIDKSLKIIKESQKIIGMVEMLEIVMDSLNFGKSEAVRRLLMEQLQEIRKSMK